MVKKIKLLLFTLIVLTGCYKVYYPPIEHYYTEKKEKIIFNETRFGLSMWDGYRWTYCLRSGDFTKGFLIINQKNYDYKVVSDTLFLGKITDSGKYNVSIKMVYDRNNINQPGIFIKK